MSEKRKPRVGLFVTCLVDTFRPSVGLATVKLLELAGCKVEVPEKQTCCAQPAFNSGDSKSTRKIATNVIKMFEQYDYVVVPSGSCAAMIKIHYPELFTEGSGFRTRADELADKTYELVSFLSDVMKLKDTGAQFGRKVTYHDSCSGLRELKIHKQPRALLSKVDGLHLEEMADADVCCGFGGTFCVKYPDISNDMVTKKAANVTNSGAEVLLAGDLGCLLNIAGKLQREGSEIEIRHIAEVLAGETHIPAIGETDQ
ncbi:MAG: (Fe-S)-binding protein [Amylibacter sp.]|nr:(Fe-S)-binding protein [Amylibacter sp.]